MSKLYEYGAETFEYVVAVSPETGAELGYFTEEFALGGEPSASVKKLIDEGAHFYFVGGSLSGQMAAGG